MADDLKIKLPTLQDINKVTSAGADKRSESMKMLDGTLTKQMELNAERVAEAEKDTAYIESISAAEQAAQETEGTKRKELTSDISTGLDDLEAAENMNPFMRTLRSFVDQGIRPSVIRKELERKNAKLTLFESTSTKRKDATSRTVNLFNNVNSQEDKGFAAKQAGIDARIKLASQYSTLAQQELTAASKGVDLRLKTRKAQRVEREDTLSRMSSDMINQMEATAKSNGGVIDVDGVTFTSGDFEQKRKSLRKIDLDLSNAENAVQMGNDEIAQTNYTRALERMNPSELETLVRNGGDIKVGEDRAGQPIIKNIPLNLVSAELGNKMKQRGENLTLSSDYESAVASAGLELEIFKQNSTQVLDRVSSFSGANSGMANSFGEDMARTAVSLNGLAGLTGESRTDLKGMQEAAASGGISSDGLAKISTTVSKANESTEKMIEETAKRTFNDVASQTAFQGFLSGQAVSPQAAMESLVRMSVGGLPRGANKDPSVVKALEAGNEYAQEWLQKNLPDSQNFATMSPEERSAAMMASLFDSSGAVKPENLALMSNMSRVMYESWVADTSDRMLIGAVQIPDSPAFGKIDPNLVQSALNAAKAQANDQMPSPETSQDFNEKAVIEASTFMRILRGVAVDGGNMADLYIQQLESPQFQQAVRDQAVGVGNSWGGYLMDNGAIQGNFENDMGSLLDAYKHVNSQYTGEAMAKRAQLSQLFTDRNQQDIFTMRIAGYLDGGASPEVVDEYIDSLVEKHGQDAEAIKRDIDTIQQENAVIERTRKKLAGIWGTHESTSDAIIAALLSPIAAASVLLSQGVNESRANSESEDAAEDQEIYGVFPPQQ